MLRVFGSLKISNKLAVIFIVLLAMMGVGGSVGLYNATRIAQVTRDLYGNFYQRSETLSAMEREFVGQRQELLLHTIVTKQGSRAFLENSIYERRETIASLLQKYGRYEMDDETKMILKDFTAALFGYWGVQDKVLNTPSGPGVEDAIKIVESEGRRSFNTAMIALKKLLDEEKAAADLAYHRSERLSSVITLLTLAFTVAAIIMAAGLWFIVTRSLVKPILSIENSARRMAKGELTHRAEVISRDEIGSLAEEFNRMAEALQQYYATMERKVEDRTEALREANIELRDKSVELEEKNVELARANMLKSQFLANVSHELRTPLNSIIGFSELLQEKSFGELNEKQSQYVQFIHSSGGHLLQLINSILDLSKIEAGRMELMAEETSLTDLIGEVLGAIRPLATKRDITIECKEAVASPVVTVDKAKFKQILLNLLSNAVKFNVQGGRVGVSWDVMEEPVGMDMQKFLQVAVRDTGGGIRHEDISRLFREFEQLDPSITKEHGGTGLGLALTKKLVELHGGHIWVESEVGKGCEFLVKIPQSSQGFKLAQPATGGEAHPALAPGEAPGDEAPLPFRPEPGEKAPLVVVAGEGPDINQLLRIYLDGGGYEVATASDGEELLELARRKKPFAVVTGLKLPKKDGWEVLRELKESAETSDIPVVIVSASEEKDLGFALGALDYMEKPVDRERLLKTLGRINFAKREGPKRMSVLVADDDPHVISFMEDVLQAQGIAVLKASTGEEAVKTAIERTPDLMILDLVMPGISGFEVVERLREHPVTRKLPVIIFSARELTPEEKSRLGTGIKRVISKGDFKKEDLLSELRLLELAYPERAHMVDLTTRLFNKRYFDITLAREISRADRYDHVFSVLLIDIDDFSAFNSVNGSGAGNVALSEMAGLMTGMVRRADIAIRYGGDEFAVILPGIDGDDALVVADKLRIAFKAHRFPAQKGPVSLSVSIGVLTYSAVDGGDIVEKLKLSAARAYDGGGNKVVAYRKRGEGVE